MAMDDLTKRQQDILAFLKEQIAANGYPPSVREICEAIGLSSTSTVHSHLNTLEAKGFIRREANGARTITLVDDADDPESTNHLLEDDPYANTQVLPLLGRVAAGEPILAEQNIEETLVLPTSLVGDAGSFLLEVHGESMIEAGILDGDYVVVKEQSDASNGDIVVALLDDSATVKTFYRDSGRIRLQPQNPTMDPIYPDQVTILGKVVALLRTL